MRKLLSAVALLLGMSAIFVSCDPKEVIETIYLVGDWKGEKCEVFADDVSLGTNVEAMSVESEGHTTYIIPALIDLTFTGKGEVQGLGTTIGTYEYKEGEIFFNPVETCDPIQFSLVDFKLYASDVKEYGPSKATLKIGDETLKINKLEFLYTYKKK